MFSDFLLISKLDNTKASDAQGSSINASNNSKHAPFSSIKNSNHTKSNVKKPNFEYFKKMPNRFQKKKVFSSFERQIDSPLTTHENIDFSAANFRTVMDWVSCQYQSHFKNKDFDEKLLTKIMLDFGYLNQNQLDNKSTILIAKYIENMTKFINLVEVKNKFRLLIQIIYFFENQVEFCESLFFDEIERLSGQMEVLEEVDIKNHINEIQTRISYLKMK